jgi:hypothetical protein
MIAPAGKFHAIEAELLGFGANGFKWEVGPLAAEKSNGTSHGVSPTRTTGKRNELRLLE